MQNLYALQVLLQAFLSKINQILLRTKIFNVFIEKKSNILKILCKIYQNYKLLYMLIILNYLTKKLKLLAVFEINI